MNYRIGTIRINENVPTMKQTASLADSIRRRLLDVGFCISVNQTNATTIELGHHGLNWTLDLLKHDMRVVFSGKFINVADVYHNIELEDLVRDELKKLCMTANIH